MELSPSKRFRIRLLRHRSLAETVLMAGLCLVVWTAGPYRAFPQSIDIPNFVIDGWQGEDGLPHSAVTAITQTADGYLWMGTGAGLVRFDGLRFLSVFDEAAPQLADSYVWAIHEDEKAQLWIGSSNGLSLYRNNELHTYTVADGLPNNFVRAILQDGSGRLWIGTYGGGVCVFDTESSTCRQLPGYPGTTDLFVNTIIEDAAGRIWVGTDTGLLGWQDDQWIHGIMDAEFREQIKALFADESGRLWLGTSNGVFIRTGQGELEPPPFSGSIVRAVRSFWEDTDGSLWIGTEAAGLYRFKGGNVVEVDAETGLSHNYIWDIFQDQEGSIWIGTNGGGLNRLQASRVQVYGAAEGLPDNTANTLIEDREGAIWFGTSKGLVRLQDDRFDLFTEQDGLANNRVFALAEDEAGALWIGTNGGGLSRYFDERFHTYTTKDGLLSDVIFSLFVDSRGDVWVGTTRGLNRIRDGKIDGYTREDGMPGGFAVVIQEGPQGELWVGTDAGLARFKNDVFTVYTTDDGLPDNAIRALYFDSAGTLWIGTRGGLSRYAGGAFRSFTALDGLPDNVIYHIEEDREGYLWLNTGRSGLVRIPRYQFEGIVNGTQASLSPLLLGRSDGMRSIEGVGGFQPAGLTDRNGRLWFLTYGGAVVADPEQITPNHFSVPVHIEDVIADNVPLHPENGTVTVPYNTNRLVIRYTGLSFLDPKRLIFRHRMVGMEDEWSYELNEDGLRRTREFTRLSPGSYTFLMTGANRDGIWSADEAALNILVPPPWWRTPFALVAFSLLFIAGVYGIVRWRVLALEARNKALEILVDERTHQVSQQARRLEELDVLKSRFFANISHEFRTPLTLILGALEALREREHGETNRRFVDTAEKQGRQLLHLVSQLLDLSKIDAGAMEFRPVAGRVEPLLRQLVGSFYPLAERRNITLEFNAIEEGASAVLDRDKFKQIIENLLSNAFKYTGEGGKIHVTLDASRTTLEIRVRDTGKGIAAEDLPYIFDRFYQGDPEVAQGSASASTGIGLALAKELVDMHGGTISADSTPGFGSCFTIQLSIAPLEAEARQPEFGSGPPLVVDDAPLARPFVLQAASRHADQPVILVVEDNLEVLAFVSMCLEKHFQVLQATSGVEALRVLGDHMPDMILSDVMMAGMNGFELCRRVKEDPGYKHIPIILLTARASEESIEEGLNAGADDYIIKPFNAKELRLRIQNAIDSRSVLREKYSRELIVKPADVSIDSADESFLRNAMAMVESKMGEPGFGVDTLAAELGLSRRQLQRRLRDVSSISPSEFIRNMRLERAAQLLEQDAGNVSEVAYKVGFRKPAHFSELFRKKFGKSPTEYRT